MVKIFGNEFQRFCWRLKRELRKNRKPILLFFGNGYESQILLLALHKLKKKFKIIHVSEQRMMPQTRKVLQYFKTHETIVLRPYRADKDYKTFIAEDVYCPENLNFGFSPKDYFLIAGFKLSEPTLIKANQKGNFDGLYCPLLRYPDESIQTLYQDMKDNERLGKFLWQNNTSDSHHTIEVV